jgi:hypothetical protein
MGEGPETAPAASRKVAIIAVHGVAYHDPGASASAMADLLCSLPTTPRAPSGAPRDYSSFESETIHMPLQPVAVWTYPLPGAATRFGRFFEFLQEGSTSLAAYLRKWVRTTGAAPAPGTVGSEFMRFLLRDYYGGGDGNTYVTTRLEGRRTVPKRETEVHIYEVYWADLARPKNTLLSFLFASFQLLLHMGSLSRLAIDSGSGEDPGGAWGRFSWAQKWAVRMLQIPIPLLNLIVFIAALSVLPLQLSPRWCAPVAWLAAGALGAASGFLALLNPRLPVPGGPVRWALVPGLCFLVGAALGYALFLGAGSGCSSSEPLRPSLAFGQATV